VKIDSLIWNMDNGWKINREEIINRDDATIIFIFGTAKAMKENLFFKDIKQKYPNALLVGGSSAGTIYADEIIDDQVVASVLHLEKGSVKLAVENIIKIEDSFKIGEKLVSKLITDDLKHIVILTDSINLNGSMLVDGLNSIPNCKVPISGGMLGEEAQSFYNAYVLADSKAVTSIAIAVGFYGDEVETFYGSDSGWDDFGAERIITKSTGNIVYEIDGEPALDLYKKYLGNLANELPASGLRFPLNIWNSKEIEKPVIRTLMGIDEKERSLIFVSDVPEGFKAKLMKTNIDGLIDGSEKAINQTGFMPNNKSAYCLAVSCIGRRLILDQLTEEELVVINDYIGDKVELSGFYSYGEIAPFSKELKTCRFHNQTMTVTVITEK